MSNDLLLELCVGVPLVVSVLLPAMGGVSERARNAAALLAVVFSFACAVALLPTVLGGGTATVHAGALDVLHADKLAVFMAMVSLGVGAVIVFYSWGYIAKYEHRNEYYFMVVLFLAAMMGLVFARNLIILYVFWEITALVCWRLIGFFREKECVRRADKAFLVTVFGAVVMLIGFIVACPDAPSLSLDSFNYDRFIAAPAPLSNLAVALILVGILSKSATLPLHTWLPDAGVAPSPVTALLHAAVLVKIGVYVFARLFVATFTVAPLWHEVVPWIAAASALVSAGAALVSTDMKRIIAYSTISQLAFIFLGLAVGSPMAVGGGLLYILMHSIAKGGLFLCAGVVEHQTHCKDITKLGGLAKTMPITAVSFAVCAFSVMGIPPFGGFFGKYLVLNGAITNGQIAVGLTFLFGSVLTVMYLFRIFSAIFLGEPKTAFDHPVHEGTRGMVVSVALLAVLALAGGLLIKYPAEMAESTAIDMLRSSPPIARSAL